MAKPVSESLLPELLQTVDAASKSKTPQEGMQNLMKAFSLFSQETGRLEQAYALLQERFMLVNRELEESNQTLKVKVQELDSVSNYLKNILSNISQGILFVTLDGSVTTYNHTAELILGTPSASVLFKKFWDHFSDDLFGFSLRLGLSSSVAPQNTHIQLTTPNQPIKELEVSTSLVKTRSFEQYGIIILFRDVTEMRRLQMLASRHDRLKELGEMAAALAHEIRNPLGGIEGFAGLLYRDLEGTPAEQNMASQIIMGAQALNKLVNNVLNYARPLQVSLHPIELLPLLQEVKQLVEVDPLLPQPFEFAIEAAISPIIIPIDRDMLKGVLLNLVVNATQAMPHGGKLILRLSKEANYAIIAVADTGQGIAPQNLEKIFSPFFTTKHAGNGFGLSEVHKMVQAHGGTVEVQSVVNKGSTFTIKLPI